MKILVDTSIWSHALRHSNFQNTKLVEKFKVLILENEAYLIGPLKQEILSGIKHEAQFIKLSNSISSFPSIDIIDSDYYKAAQLFNTCRKNGVQGSNTDFLICAVAIRNNLKIFTNDNDFTFFSEYIPIELY